MFCPNCGSENTARGKFCTECGTSLGTTHNLSQHASTLQALFPAENRLLLAIPGTIIGIAVLAFSMAMIFSPKETIISEVATTTPATEIPDEATRLHTELKKIADAASSTLPMILDKETVLEKIFVSDDNKMNYRYNLINYSVGEIEWNGLEKTLRPTVVESFCTDPSGDFFKTNNIPVKSLYYDTYGLFIGEIEVTTADCSN
jgi:hypothetical protein